MDRRDDTPISALAAWRERPCPESFPYDEVVAEYRHVGKHFVSPDLLEALDQVREALPEGGAGYQQVSRFLDTALDKLDGRYDNPSYLALEQLELPGADGCPAPAHALRQRDRLLVLLLADMMQFELATAHGCLDLQPELRPEKRITAKRCHHALRAMRPALERLGIEVAGDEADPMTAGHRVCRAVLAEATPAERRKLQLTAIPVSLVHDEYMFLRGLQSYEITFALIAVQLTAAILALTRGDAAAAADAITAAEAALAEGSPLWSLVGTMQPEAFLRFREYTDGASAIQSRSYKRVESLCRQPDAKRLDSPAYHSVPDVRERVIAGQPNIDDALGAAVAEGILTGPAHTTVLAAMDRFEAAIFKWRKTHHSIAVRMLGERRGTGYTEGVGYLEQARTIPVFKGACPLGHGARSEAECPAQPVAASA